MKKLFKLGFEKPGTWIISKQFDTLKLDKIDERKFLWSINYQYAAYGADINGIDVALSNSNLLPTKNIFEYDKEYLGASIDSTGSTSEDVLVIYDPSKRIKLAELVECRYLVELE